MDRAISDEDDIRPRERGIPSGQPGRPVGRRQLLGYAGLAVLAAGVPTELFPAAGHRGGASGAQLAVAAAPTTTTSDDTAMIQALMTAAGANADVYLPPGSYVITSTLSPLAGQRLYSDGAGAMIAANTTGTPFVMIDVAAGSFALEKVDLDHGYPGTGASTSTLRARPASATDPMVLSVTDCTISHSYGRAIDAVSVLGSNNVVPGGSLTVSGCTVDGAAAWGVVGQGLASGSIANTSATAATSGIWIGQSGFVDITDCTVTGNTSHGITVIYSHDWTVSGCTAIGNAGWGICAGGAVTGLTGYAPNNNFTISDNLCTTNVKGGITLDPTIAGSDAIQPSQSTVENNECYGNDDGTTGATHGINITHSGTVQVSGNKCHDQDGSGIQISNSQSVTATGNTCYDMRYGIRVDGTVPGNGCHSISDNTLYDNTVADFFDNSTPSCTG